jgi:hypothetical protein
MKHYLMTTDAHFEAAVSGNAKAAQNPAQQVHIRGGREQQRARAEYEKTPFLPENAASRDYTLLAKVEDNGLEPMTSCMPCKRSPN